MASGRPGPPGIVETMSTPTITATECTALSGTSAATAHAPDQTAGLRVITVPGTEPTADPVHHVISASGYAEDLTDTAEPTPAGYVRQPTGTGPAGTHPAPSGGLGGVLLAALLAMILVGTFLTQLTGAGQGVVLAAILVSGLTAAGVTRLIGGRLSAG